MAVTTFNKAQLHLLRMMSYVKTDEGLDEIKKALHGYFATKAQEEADKLWDEGVLSQDKLDEILEEHTRTRYIP
ncbi:MAG: hypothetical protein LUC86_08085 [Prevotellaceae bacterium]|nr:hypothetical protein [Prevotellaceae bacterium]MCD8304766.1 hypothetical protein [Prevotellaceae bacterium]